MAKPRGKQYRIHTANISGIGEIGDTVELDDTTAGRLKLFLMPVTIETTEGDDVRQSDGSTEAGK